MYCLTRSLPGALDHGKVAALVVAGDQLQQVDRLVAHVLRPRMAGEMQGDAAVERLQSGCEAVLPGDVDDVFRDVEGRLGQLLDQRIVGPDQRSEEHTAELQSLMRNSYGV